jgi:hypothetical protein
VSPIEWDDEIYRSRDELARRVTPIVGVRAARWQFDHAIGVKSFALDD